MAIYAIWNNKGGVGKSYLTFQIACEYAREHRDRTVIVIDLCPQANASVMLLGGMDSGEDVLNQMATANPRLTISGYMEERIRSPYVNPNVGARYATQVRPINHHIPANVHLVVGDEALEVQASRVLSACLPGPTDAWRTVHGWVGDLINDLLQAHGVDDTTVFIDCNPSFSIYTELALTAAERLILPFSADGSSKRAVRSVLALVYGVTRLPGTVQSDFFVNANRFRMSLPLIYCYVGNRMTQYLSSAAAFRAVVNEITDEIWDVWQANPNRFHVHPPGAATPRRRSEFRSMFCSEIADANTASVVSQALGIPLGTLTAGSKAVGTRRATVNQSQLDTLVPNLRTLISTIE